MDPASIGAAVGALLVALASAATGWYVGNRNAKRKRRMEEFDVLDLGDRDRVHDLWVKATKDK